MNSKWVDLVHYPNGERTVIGKALVDFDDDGHFDITGKVNIDKNSRLGGIISSDVKHLSIAFENPNKIKDN